MVGGVFLCERLSRATAPPAPAGAFGTQRRTTDAAELALAVLYQNPVQNFAITPNNLTDAPAAALDFLREVPTTWDETRLIDGYPGRRAGGRAEGRDLGRRGDQSRGSG